MHSISKKSGKFVCLNKIDKFYKLDYKGDYGFHDLLKFQASLSPFDSESKIMGVTSDEAMRRFLGKKFYNDKQIPLPLWSANGGCDSFNSWNPVSKSWNFSRNFDYFYNTNEIIPSFWTGETTEFKANSKFNIKGRVASAIVITHPKKALEISFHNTCIKKHAPVESMSLVYLPYFFGDYSDPTIDKNNYWKIAPYYAFDGMNKNGVSISINVSGNAENTHQKDAITLNYDKINLNSFALVRLILDYAKDVKDALELMSNFYLNDMSFEYNEPIHYQITDKTGTSVIVEFKEGFTMPTIVVTPEFVAKADKEHKYDIAGKNKKFIINENFNLSNLDANFGEAKFDSWTKLNKYMKNELPKKCLNKDLRWAEYYGRYFMVRAELENYKGVVPNPMSILKNTRMLKWNTWSVVYDLTHLTTEVVYMQQYDKPSYTFSF